VLLKLILKNGPYNNAKDELIIIGHLFGNIIEKKLKMQWIVYQDKEGIYFALVDKYKCVFAFPEDMILKRAEKGELGDIENLYYEIVKAIKKEIDNPKVKGHTIR